MSADYKLKIGGTDGAGNVEILADDGGECWVASVYGDNTDDPKVIRRDAERIVRAWNLYDDCVAVCEAVMLWAKTPGNHGGNPYTKDFVRLAEALLAKAKKGEPSCDTNPDTPGR